MNAEWGVRNAEYEPSPCEESVDLELGIGDWGFLKWGWRLVGLGMAGLALVSRVLAAGQAANGTAVAGTATNDWPTVGMEGRLEVALPGSLIEAKPVDEKSPVLVRIAQTRPHGTLIWYDLRYIGLEPGRYDLRDVLRRQDGSALGELPPLAVEVKGLLPVPHSGELIETAPGLPGWLGGYRAMLIALGVAWVVAFVPLWFCGRPRSKAPAVAVIPPPPTLAERLRPLVEQAAAHRLTTEGQAQLERLLVSYWRERLRLGDRDPAETIAVLRAHPEAGELLRALENWLHRPPGAALVDVRALLAPYGERATGPGTGPAAPPSEFPQ